MMQQTNSVTQSQQLGQSSSSVLLSANGTLSGATKRLLVVSSSGYLTEYHMDPRPHPDGQKATEQSSVAMVVSERICWPLQRQITWNTIPLSLPIRNPLLAADNLCRRHYDMTRSRMKEKAEQRCKASSTRLSDSPPLGSGGPQVRCEQPRSLKNISSSRNGKQSKSKKSSRNPVDLSHAPESADMQRNGVTSDDEVRSTSPNKIVHSSSETTVLPSSTSDEWLSQVEMITHEGPARRLWMGPQFHFKRFLSTGNTHVISSLSSALLSNQHHVVDPYSGASLHDNYRTEDVYEEELDVRSLNIHAVRSEPVPTPAPRQSPYPDNQDVGCYTSISIEAGSGNFDRTARMLEIKSNGSLEERRYSSLGSSGRPCEEALIERIADAMQDYGTVASGGKFSPSSSPRRRTLGPKHDVEDLVLAESFDFKTFDSPSLHIPTDS